MISLVAVVGAVAFELTYWLTETFHVDCVPTTAAKSRCVAESSKRGGRQLYKRDETTLLVARTDRDVHDACGITA